MINVLVTLCFVISACFYYNKFAARDKRVFVFPAPWSSSWPLVLALAPGPGSPICNYRPTRQFTFTGSSSQFVFTNPGPKFVFTGPGPKFLFTGPGQSGAWACIYQLVPQFVFTGSGLQLLLPCSEFAFTFLSIVVAVAVVILAIVVIS